MTRIELLAIIAIVGGSAIATPFMRIFFADEFRAFDEVLFRRFPDVGCFAIAAVALGALAILGIRRAWLRRLILGLATAIFAVIAAVMIDSRPYLFGATIISAANRPEVSQYAQEFADALSISTHWNTGAPLGEPYIYLRGGGPNSPDGRFTLDQLELRNSYHEITLSRAGSPSETVLVLQECDPGSGTSHHWQWSRDSNAVFIYGCARPAGHALTNNLALIYIVDQRTLYSIDLSQPLSERLKAATNAPNQSMKPTAPARNKFCVFATTPCRGLSLLR